MSAGRVVSSMADDGAGSEQGSSSPPPGERKTGGAERSTTEKRGRAREHRTVKLMEGGAEEGHPLSPSEARKARAVREHLRAVYEPTSLGVPAWRIEGTHGQSYRVLVPAFPQRDGAQCTCPDFLTRGLGTCKHLEATLAQAAASPPPSLTPSARPRTPGVSWAEIEPAQQEVVARLTAPGSVSNGELLRSMRRVGWRLISPA